MNQPEVSTQRVNESFHVSLMRMLFFMRITQLMITLFQEHSLIKAGNHKQMKNFSKEVYTKLEWFKSVIKKMSNGQDEALEQELDFDGDKLNNIATIAEFIIESDDDISNETDLMTSRTKRRELFSKAWKMAKGESNPAIEVDMADFDAWYADHFKS